MRLKKIELQGFKSFADKTEIVFLDGVTTIVGPNGSGKSNISDALKWVLGEQSVKTLRGSKMEDVIFAGTQARKKVGFAEVSMYLDNTDGTLPVEYKEVVVTRRVYRTGESTYLINNNECRLKDVQELFMDTGVGKDGYSIISQGKIDEILSSKSEERRHIFEEASGIVKYRTRKEEACKKLNNTNITLERVSDILNEIENVIGPLEKKASTAKKYLILKDELKKYDVVSFLKLVSENADSLKKLDDTIYTFEQDIEKQLKASNDLEQKKEELKERLGQIVQKIEETQDKYFKLQTETEKLNSKIELEDGIIKKDKQNIQRLNDEIKEDIDKISLLKEEITKRMEKKEAMSSNKIKFENELNEKMDSLNKIMETLDEKGVVIEEIKRKIDEANDRKYDLKVDISSMEATFEANEKQIEEKKKQKDKNISLKDSINVQKDDIYLCILNKTKERENVDKNITAINDNKKKLQEKYDGRKNEIQKLNQEIMTKTSKLNYLVNIEKENEGYYKSVKEALEYSKNDENVYGTLASLISTDEKYEYAIEIALGGYIQNIVCKTEVEAKKVIEYLKENMLGRVTFLPLNSLKDVRFDIKNKAQRINGYIGIASELVRYDAKYSKVVNLALGSTIIVDNLDNAINMSKILKGSAKIVTLSGEQIATTGSITGGKTSHKSAGLIGRSEKIASLKTLIASETEKYNSLAKESNTVLDEIKSLEKLIEQEKVKKENLNIEIATCNQKYENIKNEIDKLESNKEATQNLIDNLENENKIYKEKIDEFLEEIKKIEEENSKEQVAVDEYAKFNKEKQQEIDFLNEDIVNLKISLSSFDESITSLDEMKEKIEQDIKNFEFGIERKNEQIAILNSTIEESQNKINIAKEKIKEQITFKDEYVKITENLKSEKSNIEKSQENVETSILEGVKRVEKLKDEKSKVESKKIKFDIELENIKNKMWDEYELTVSSAKKLSESIDENIKNMDIKNINKNSDLVKKEIKDLGEVNVSSIEEYKNTKERYDFISKQKVDLEETKTKLNNLIANMTSIMKNQFSKQFKLITENFDETFKELFGGGKAELKLSDENNILESGIEIEVQPPGKKLQSMMLLSGGERALTAISLLFAILKLKSPPFCILDEIEAALDDVNVHRFAKYIQKYSKNTQFIVITHRKGTMEVASSTYGVTMQEYGISKIVSMKLK